MTSVTGNRWWGLALLFGGLFAVPASQADSMAAVQILGEGGCGGILPASRPLHHSDSLDRAAELWASGSSPAAATQRSGYEAEATVGLHITGTESSTVQLLKRSSCHTVSDPSLHDIGVYHRGLDTWLVLASAYAAPVRSQAPILAARALRLVNEARARGARCGTHAFGPVPPVRLSETLGGVAWGHANDMAEHDYFDHQDLSGHTPAERVRAVGYREKLVGENIAYGPKSAEEAVQGWLDSPDHCENIMDPRFAEMGIAYAAGHASRHGLFWVQLMVAPSA